MQAAEKVGMHNDKSQVGRPSLCARVGGGYIYRSPMTPEKDRSMTRAQSSPALNRIYGERRSGKVRREAERRDSKYEVPELSLVNEECQELRAELRERRREESRLSVRLEQLESSVYDRMQKLHTVLRQTHDVALQQELDQLMADSRYAERRASSREGGSEARRFRHVLGPERTRDNSSWAWRQNIDALKESERANRRSSNVATAESLGRRVADLTADVEMLQLKEELQKMDVQQRDFSTLPPTCYDQPESSRPASEQTGADMEEKMQPPPLERVRADSESAAEAKRAAEFWKMKAEAAEKRAWAMAEAMNQLALVADERHVEALEKQLSLQQQLATAEHRCEAFLEVWESVVQMAGSGDKGESSPQEGKSVFIFQPK